MDLFDGIKLTLLTEVAQNGVHTLESVQVIIPLSMPLHATQSNAHRGPMQRCDDTDAHVPRRACTCRATRCASAP